MKEREVNSHRGHGFDSRRLHWSLKFKMFWFVGCAIGGPLFFCDFCPLLDFVCKKPFYFSGPQDFNKVIGW